MASKLWADILAEGCSTAACYNNSFLGSKTSTRAIAVFCRETMTIIFHFMKNIKFSTKLLLQQCYRVSCIDGLMHRLSLSKLGSS